MGLITRLDGRTENNNSFKIKNTEGDVIAEVVVVSKTGTTISINTIHGLFIEKPNGWVNKKMIEGIS